MHLKCFQTQPTRFQTDRWNEKQSLRDQGFLQRYSTSLFHSSRVQTLCLDQTGGNVISFYDVILRKYIGKLSDTQLYPMGDQRQLQTVIYIQPVLLCSCRNSFKISIYLDICNLATTYNQTAQQSLITTQQPFSNPIVSAYQPLKTQP